MLLYLLFLLSILGVFETIYLYKKRKSGERPVCIVGKETCSIVLESKYKNIFLGIPNDVFGLIFYIATTILSIFLLVEIEPMQLISLAMKILVAGGVVMSLILTYIQWRILKAWCFWCLMSAITIFLMEIIILFL